MRILSRTALALLACFWVVVPAVAAGPSAVDLGASLSWRLEFGSGTPKPGLGLALGYRSDDLAAPRSRLLSLDLDSDHALASLAGLPLVARSYQADETGQVDGVIEHASAGERPWYTRSWVLWTVGGLAASAALAGSAGGSGDTGSNDGFNCQTNGGCGINCTNGDCTVPSPPGSNVTGVGDDGIGCVNGTCAVPCDPNTSKPEGCTPFISGDTAAIDYTPDYERIRWLDAGTGHMGDLVAE